MREPVFRDVDVQLAFVEAGARAEVEDMDVVRVVGDEDHPRDEPAPVDDEQLRVPFAGGEPEPPQARERVAAAAMRLAPVDEVGVQPERHVVEEDARSHASDVDSKLAAGIERVERPRRVATVQADVTGEVVARPEGHAHEGMIVLERNLGDGAEGPVSCRRRPSPSERRFARRRPARGRGLRAPGAAPRAQARTFPAPLFRTAGSRSVGRAYPANEPPGPLSHAVSWPIMVCVNDCGLHYIEDDLSETWVEEWAHAGVTQIESLLRKHAAFQTFLETAED